MFLTEDKIRKHIITADGEDVFQIRYFHDEDVGVLTTRSEKSYLILDSIDYWYDLIQERYPAKQKCRCKNDYFRLCFDYVPRIGTDDHRAIEIISWCAECGRQRKLAEIDIDYSPTEHLFEQPITYCARPKIKYKTYSLNGYWSENELYGLIEFLLQKQMLVYCWYWSQTENKRCVRRMAADELKRVLFAKEKRYLKIYFSLEPLDEIFTDSDSGDESVYIDRDVWRKREIIVLNAPILVAAKGAGYFYSMNFCSEFLEAGQIQTKTEPFCCMIREFLAYSRKKLK